MKNLTREVLTLIAKYLNKKLEDVGLDDRFIEDLGADSTDTIALLIQSECYFGIVIGEEEIFRVRTPREAISLIVSKL